MTSWSRDHLTIRKKVSDHLRYFKPLRIQTFGKMLDDENIHFFYKKKTFCVQAYYIPQTQMNFFILLLLLH